MSDKRICHAEGDKCLGCDHYRGKADKCVYADTPKPDTVTISREFAEWLKMDMVRNAGIYAGTIAGIHYKELTKAMEVKGE